MRVYEPPSSGVNPPSGPTTLKHGPVKSNPFAGSARFRRRRGQIAGSGRQKQRLRCGHGEIKQEAVRWSLESGTIARRVLPDAARAAAA